MKCPFLSSIGIDEVNCNTQDCRRIGTVKFDNAGACRRHTDTICFDKFLDCEKYREYYADPKVFSNKSCAFCCNSSGYTGLPKGYNGQEWCFCQKWQQPMQKNATCDWNNRHPDWMFETVPKNRKEQTMIQNIDITKLFPHKDNPRKDLGDLTELAESIKTKGILQNLTVVPDHDTYDMDTKEFEQYIVIIGHRRMAAAKLAGLTKVPCSITEMTKQEQVATMLLENMQRADLTIYEQAQGFQMMIDFGESVKSIAEKTGFSETTVRHRIKLNELDPKKLVETMSRNIRIEDYIALEKIQNQKLRNKVLEHIGTNNFTWEFNSAIDQEAMPDRREKLLEFLKDWAQQIEKAPANSYNYEKCFYKYKMDDYKKPKDANKGGYTFFDSGTDIRLYKKKDKSEKKVPSPEEKAFRQKEIQLKDILEKAYKSRYEFVKSFKPGKTHQKIILDFVMHKLFRDGQTEQSELLKMLDIEKPKLNNEKTPNVQDYRVQETTMNNLIMDKFEKQPDRLLFMATYLGYSDSKSNSYILFQEWCNKIEYKENKYLNLIYDTLTSLGYEMSDEERALRDGTHELFMEG